MRKRATPDAPYIGEFIRAEKVKFNPLHTEITDTEALILQAHNVHVPPVFTKNTPVHIIKTAIAEDIIRRIVAMETVGEPSYRIIPLDPKPSFIERASIVQEWANATRRELEIQSRQRTYSEHVYNTLGYGLSGLWDEYMPHSWDKYWRTLQDKEIVNIFDEDLLSHRKETTEERRERLLNLKYNSPLPWYETALDPRSFMWEDDALGIRELCIGFRRPKLEVGLKYGIDGKTGRLAPQFRPSTTDVKLPIEPGELGVGTYFNDSFNPSAFRGDVEFWIYYNREWVCYYSDGVLLKRVPLKYHRIPVFIASGLMTTSKDPVKRYRSILSPIKSLIKGLDKLLTMKLHWAGYGSYPMGVIKTSADAGGQLYDPTDDQLSEAEAEPRNDEDLEWVPGKFMRLPPGEEFMWLEAPDVGRALTQMIDIYIKMIETTGSLPPVVKGYAQGSDQPGYAINQLLQSARTVWEPAMADVGTSNEESLDYRLWCIREHIGEKVYVVGFDPSDPDRVQQKALGVGPKEAAGPFKIQVQIKAAHPVRDAALAQQGMALLEKNHISEYTFMSDYLGYENPEREIFKRDLEQVMKSPEFETLKKYRVIKELMLDPMWQEAIDFMKQFNGQGTPPNPGMPMVGPGLPGAGAEVGPAMALGGDTLGATPPAIPNTVNEPGGLPVNV